ncbi:MAG TPA: hypothetical protein VFX59_14830 [Polyangiales bacterium]|nr:hypothetical protein [Polyangiales bacterium]
MVPRPAACSIFDATFTRGRMAQLSSLLVTGADGRWHPGVGDASSFGWVTVLAYFVAAGLALRALWLHRAGAADGPSRASWPPVRDEALLARFWSLVMLAMVALGINKQLDLQSWFAEMGRDLAHDQGWYHRRRVVQGLFILAVGAGGGLATAALAYSLRRVLPRVMGAVVGLGALITFVIIRATSLHHIDALLGRGRIRLNWVLELGGIGLIALSALRQKSSTKLGS